MKINGLTEEELFLLLVIENFKQEKMFFIPKKLLKTKEIGSIFVWYKSQQGHKFWQKIDEKNPTFHHKFL